MAIVDDYRAPRKDAPKTERRAFTSSTPTDVAPVRAFRICSQCQGNMLINGMPCGRCYGDGFDPAVSG